MGLELFETSCGTSATGLIKPVCVPIKGVSEVSLDSSQAHSDPIDAACVNWCFEESVWVQRYPIGQAARGRIWVRVLRGSRVWDLTVPLSS